MSSVDAPYILPDGAHVWVEPTAEASKRLPHVLDLFRSGRTEPVVFGDAGRPEAAIIPVETWRALVAVATDEDGFDLSHLLVEARPDNPELC